MYAKLAFRNVRRSLRDYMIYFITLTLTNLDAEYFKTVLDEYGITKTTYPLGMCCRNELFLLMAITNEFYCFTDGCCEQCGVGAEDMLDCLIGECRMSKTIE